MQSENLNIISEAIDNLLNGTPWGHKEKAFYKMLLEKVRVYKDRYKESQSLSDNEAILKNVREQPLFRLCNSDVLVDIVKGMELKTLVETNTPHYKYSLCLKLTDTAYFSVEYHNNITGDKVEHIKYRVMYHNEDKSKHGYVVYYSSDNPKGRHLPEYEKISEVLPELGRVECIHLATELVSYYDVHRIIADTHIGARYPISLIELSQQITTKN